MHPASSTSPGTEPPRAPLPNASRRIRYLAGEGIHPREIKCLAALDAALPSHWVFYAGLEYFPGHESPIELDLIILIDDRLLLVEVKDWMGPVRSVGAKWISANDRRRDAPSRSVASKARKLGEFLKRKGLGGFYVDGCVIMSSAREVEGLPDKESLCVFNLEEAKTLGDARVRRERLAQVPRARSGNPIQRTDAFDRLFGDRNDFRALEADFSGFRIVEGRVAHHASGVWVEHRAEEKSAGGVSSLLRCWDFSRLPPEMNSQQARRAVVGRERRVVEHLNAVGSRLADGSSILRALVVGAGSIAVDHHDVLALPATWSQLSRFVVKTRGTLMVDERLDLLTGLVGIFAELHDRGVAHRDLSPLNVWVGSPERLGVTGFLAARIVGAESWAEADASIAGYAAALPEDLDAVLASTGERRDVHSLGHAARLIVEAAAFDDGSGNHDLIPGLAAWLTRAAMADPALRFQDAREMADEFARLRATAPVAASLDPSRLAAFETAIIPFVRWPPGADHVEFPFDLYGSKSDGGGDVIVKVWTTCRIGVDFAVDLEVLRMLEGVSRLQAGPITGLPRFLEAGVSRVGPYCVAFATPTLPLEAALAGAPGPQLPLVVVHGLLRAVRSMHTAGLAHGDLTPDRIAVFVDDAGAARAEITGLFDLRLHAHRDASPDRAPDLSHPSDEPGSDRFAAAGISRVLLAPFESAIPAAVLEQIDLVIDSRGSAELDFAIAAVDGALTWLAAPPPPSLTIVAPDLPVPRMRLGTGLTVRAFDDAGALKLILATTAFEMWLRASQTGYVSYGFVEPSFRSLVSAGSEGLPLSLDLVAHRGNPAGIRELYDFLVALPALQPRLEIVRRRQALPTTGANVATVRPDLPIDRHWRRVLEIEQELLPELEVGDVTSSGSSATFEYLRLGGDFDFDPTDVVEVSIAGRNHPIGTLDIDATSSRSATVVDLETPLKKGDRLRLTSRRGGTSFDRRRKAVERILRGDAEITDLLEYFDPASEKTAEVTPAIVDEDEIAKTYGLNEGQASAFVRILQTGPLGLLQGPPGTGKTRFIAAFVHWLLTKGGAGRVLLVSQSHEAVNAALETLIDRFHGAKDRLGLLRIGTKGITDKIRPYHSEILRERYRSRFEGAMKARVAAAASAVGIPRRLAHDVVEIERAMAVLSRRLTMLEAAPWAEGETRAVARARGRKIQATQAAFKRAAERILGEGVDPARHIEEIGRAYRRAQLAHGASDANMKALLKIVELSVSWLAALSTSHRNFDEFLARTRSVIAGTCVGIGQSSLRIDSGSFEWVIIDEAARCTSGELAVAAQLGRRLLLVGDQRQLPPMLDRRYAQALSESFPDVAEDLLLMSEFERAFETPYGLANRQVLCEQYRMREAICDLVGDIFYKPFDVELKTSPGRQNDARFARVLPSPVHAPIVWVDTTSAPGNVGVEDARRSWTNQAETVATIAALEALAADDALVEALAAGQEETPVGIICMYSAQRNDIERAVAAKPWRSSFRRLIKIETVDSYQGKENTIVIVSLTRSKGSPGHVAIPNRCNVALSRARERVIIVGAAGYWRGLEAKRSPMTRVLTWIESDARADVVDALSMGTTRHG